MAMKEYGGKPAHGGKQSSADFKPCKGCKSPAKCMKAGQCAAQKPKSKLLFSMGVK